MEKTHWKYNISSVNGGLFDFVNRLFLVQLFYMTKILKSRIMFDSDYQIKYLIES